MNLLFWAVNMIKKCIAQNNFKLLFLLFRIITNITKSKVEKNSKEQALLSLKKRQSLTTICSTEPLTKSEFFIAEVLKNLTPVSDKNMCTNPLKQNNLCLTLQNNKWQVVECKNKQK